MKGKKNDFTIIAFYEDRKPIKWTYVHTIDHRVFSRLSQYGKLKYFNVYDRREGFYIKRFYNN